MGHVLRVGLAAASIAILALSPVRAASPAGSIDEQAFQQRAVYGLPTDANTFEALSAPGVDVGSAEWGLPLTDREASELDLNGRIRFADLVDRQVMAFAEKLPTYAGAYIDQRSNGSLVVLLTDDDTTLTGQIRALAPKDGIRTVRVVTGLALTATQLDDALARVRAKWSELASSIEIRTASVDFRANGLSVGVSPEDLDRGSAFALKVSESMGVPVVVQPEAPVIETSCTDRDHCYNPMRAGIIIRNDTDTGLGTCTMGFQILIGTDEQFLTAGHCGCAYSPVDWHHMGYGVIGNEGATMVNEPTPKDVMRVQMPDAQSSALIYSELGEMLDGGSPIQGETVRASLGAGSNTQAIGTIQSVTGNWPSEYCHKQMYGAISSIQTVKGDSGSPLYRKFNGGPEWYITPLGILNDKDGQFTKILHPLNFWGATIVKT